MAEDLPVYAPEIYNKSSAKMDEIEDSSIHLTVTSIPYNVNIKYDSVDDNLSWNIYINLLRDVFDELFRVTVPGGRVAINCGNTDRKPYKPLSNLVEELLNDAGFNLRAEIIWDKMDVNVNTAWGSWLKATAPMIRDTHEYIILSTKGYEPMEVLAEPDITKDEFLTYTKSFWRILPATDKNHPAVFPIELPRRLIKLFTSRHCKVLDPFSGSGSTLWAARELGRQSVGFELSEKYAKQIEIGIAGGQQLNLGYWSNWFEEVAE